MSALANFRSIVSALKDEAPSEKARQFVDKIAGQIEARGEEWISANAGRLHVALSAEQCEAAAPVEDNRLFFMKAWQLALSA